MAENHILKKLAEHDRRFDEHDKRFDAIDKRLDEHDKRFDAIDKRFDAIDKRLDEHDKRFDKLALKLVEHDQKFEQMVTKKEFYAFKNEVQANFDEVLKILRRLDQERLFTTRWIQRLEKEVERHTQEIAKIKEILKID